MVNFDPKDLDMLRDYATEADPWTFGNGVLYEMCEKEPLHKDPEVVVGKLWLIGRSYAVPVERRKSATELSGDVFYFHYVAPAIIDSKLDQLLAALGNHQNITEANAEFILRAHHELVLTLARVTGHNVTSLASKYLHFHAPKLFYLYDTRAWKALQKLFQRQQPSRRLHKYSQYADSNYLWLFLRMMDLHEQLGLDDLTPRMLDNALLRYEARINGRLST